MLPAVLIENNKEVEFQLSNMAEKIQNSQKDHIDLEYAIVNSSWTEGIIDLIEDEKFDIVLVSQRMLLSKSKITINRWVYIHIDIGRISTFQSFIDNHNTSVITDTWKRKCGIPC